MTRPTRKGPQRIGTIDALDELQEIYFRSGIKWFPEPLFASHRQMMQAWELHRDALKAKWQTERPGFVSFAEREFDGVETDQDCDYY